METLLYSTEHPNGLTIQELYDRAVAECGLNGRAYTLDEETRVITKIGELTCVVQWPNIGHRLEAAKFFSFNQVKTTLLPLVTPRLKNCIRKQCPEVVPLIRYLTIGDK